MLDERGLPRQHGRKAAAPGLRFIGYLPQPGQIGHMGRQARQAAKAIRTEIRHDRDPGTGQKASQPPPAAPSRAG